VGRRRAALSLLAGLLALAAQVTSSLAQDGAPHEELVEVEDDVGESRLPGERVLEAGEWAEGGALSLDDVLRRVPGFSLFRRSDSRIANPTTQGVTLRGVGASGASRALVLDGETPLHDPFGGWVPWFRIPRLALRDAAVLRGGGSDLHGSGAIGGLVRLRRRAPESDETDVLAAWDSRDSRLLGAFASASAGHLRVDVAAEAWDTGGSRLVAKQARGPVDVRAWSRHEVAEATLRGRRWSARVQRYSEERGNGTALQDNATQGWALVASGGGTAWDWAADAVEQEYEQAFSAISADRTSERLTREQRVPSRSEGARAERR
jgi:outer membrane receptor protein involved in Fe transport